jgi:hypothetical protein
MRPIWLGVGLLLASCLFTGCDSGSGVSTATPENPQSGLDAVKKLQLPKTTPKGLAPPGAPEPAK